MLTNKNLFHFFIWWAVIGFSIWLGGTVFSMSVIVPMWSDSLPDSARTFFSETSFTRYIYNFFGPPWMAIRNLPVLVALIVGWKSVRHRKYLLITATILISSILFTIMYIYPINRQLMFEAGAGLNDVELTTAAATWIRADIIRFVVMVIGYIFLLKAFRLPYPQQIVASRS